jgi:hypothetical protein
MLSLGNGKLGEQVAHFDLPAGEGYCPGATASCLSSCYALRGRFHFQNVVDKLRWCFEEAQRPGFERKVIREIRRRGLLLVRLHCSGDFFSQQYAERWLRVMRTLRRVRFWFYTRSWRVPAIEAVLREMAALRNCKAWYSLDRDTGRPAERPPGVRYCYLQDADEAVGQVDLVFRTRRMLDRPAVGLPVICPSDTPSGRKAGMNCGQCGLCYD